MKPDSTSPPPCPHTVTVRRNPSRTARRPLRPTSPLSSHPLNHPPTFHINEFLSIDLNPNPNPIPQIPDSNDDSQSHSLKVFLRVRPVASIANEAGRGLKCGGVRGEGKGKCVWPKRKEKDKEKGRVKEVRSCVVVNGRDSVMVVPPEGVGRLKEELYNGFSYVFAEDATQDEVYEKLLSPIVKDFIDGKSGMLAALGPSGSGKTYTVFGSHRDPGMVPFAIRQLFSSTVGNSCKRIFYLSMFEIYSEKGRVEKILDLSPDGGGIHFQHSVLKGLKEVLITDAAQAESLIASGMSRRSTAATGSNSQSSRSQCIINIRSALNKVCGSITSLLDDPVLTFVDLAGAEREKKTGNQGKRLLEGNFINNTSMVFSLCLRSLLEHQKNPTQPMRKHFQSSLLTRYLRDYLEGKKRMALILTVKPGERDYLDTSFLLRQASPFMEIKFLNAEEAANLPHKRHNQATSVVERPKRVKWIGTHGCKDDDEVVSGGAEDICKVLEDEAYRHVKSSELNEVPAQSESSSTFGVSVEALVGSDGNIKMKRDYEIMKGFSKAIWKVLKEYKHKLKVMDQKVEVLSRSLENERTQRVELQKEFMDLKFLCSHCKKIEEHSALSTGENISDFKEVAYWPELIKVNIDTWDHIESCQQQFSNPEENYSLPPSNLDEEELCLIDGDYCASMNEEGSSLEVGEFDTNPDASHPTDILDLHRESNRQQTNVLSEREVLPVMQKAQVCHNTDTDISPSIIKVPIIGDSGDGSTTPHGSDKLFDLQTDIYEQQKVVQPGIEDLSSPINEEKEKPCLIVAEFHASRTEFGSHPEIGECNTSSETAASACDELYLHIEVYQHPVSGEIEEVDPAFNQEKEHPCCSDGDSSAVTGKVASIAGIGQSYGSKAATHLSNHLFDLAVENYVQQGDMQWKGRDHPLPSSHKEEEPSCREEMKDIVVDLSPQEVAVSIAPGDEVVSKGENKEDDSSCLGNGDFLASLDKVASSPATPDLPSTLETSPPAAGLLDAKEEIYMRHTYVPPEKTGPPLNQEEVASSPATPDLNANSETLPPATGLLDVKEEIYEQCTDVPSDEKDPPLNKNEEVLHHNGGVLCANLADAASNPGIADVNASGRPSHAAADLFDLREIEISEQSRDDQTGREDPPLPSVEEGEKHCLMDGDRFTRSGDFNSAETGESNDDVETSSPAADNFHLHWEIDEKVIVEQTDIATAPALHQNEDDVCCIGGNIRAMRSSVGTSPVMGWSCDNLSMKDQTNNMPDTQLEKFEQQSYEQQPQVWDNPSSSNQAEEEPCCIEEMADSVVNISLQPVAESSEIPVDEAVSKGEDKENVKFANTSNLALPASEEHCISRSESLKEKRPRRRLMPASSVLLRDINSVDFKEETDMSMLGGRGGGRKIVDYDTKRSKGSITLLRLLKNAHQ
ncbi:hypothetical protein Droror1_Dr00016532 [Drosera rotundifolia]